MRRHNIVIYIYYIYTRTRMYKIYRVHSQSGTCFLCFSAITRVQGVHARDRTFENIVTIPRHIGVRMCMTQEHIEHICVYNIQAERINLFSELNYYYFLNNEPGNTIYTHTYTHICIDIKGVCIIHIQCVQYTLFTTTCCTSSIVHCSTFNFFLNSRRSYNLYELVKNTNIY